MMERFTGTVEKLKPVDVTKMVQWIKGIPLQDWPQQSATQLKPAMVTNLEWHGFHGVALPVVLQVRSHIPTGIVEVYQWMLSVVMPGHEIEPHRDQQADYWKCRIHVPLVGNVKSYMIIGNGRHSMQVGFAYKVNVLETHAVVNKGKTPRIHFMFDVRG